jgi:hypothetical protein
MTSVMAVGPIPEFYVANLCRDETDDTDEGTAAQREEL